jgi:hypothetical protein
VRYDGKGSAPFYFLLIFHKNKPGVIYILRRKGKWMNDFISVKK